MASTVLLCVIALNLVINIIINVRTVKWHTIYIAFCSATLTVFILYIRLFLFFDDPVSLNILMVSGIVILFGIIPLMIKYDSRVKEHISAIVYGTFFTLLILFFPVNSYINVIKDNGDISFRGLKIRIILELVLNYLIIGSIFILVKYTKLFSYKSIMISIIITIGMGSITTYNRYRLGKDVNFEYELLDAVDVVIEDRESIFSISTENYFEFNYYGFYEDTIYYYTYSGSNNSSIDKRYTFGSYNIVTKEISPSYGAAECVKIDEKPMFYGGYTYLGCDNSLGVLYEGEYEEIANHNGSSFTYSRLIVENEEAYIFSTNVKYSILGNEVIEEVYYDGSFEEYIEKEGVVYPVSTGTSNIVYINNKPYTIRESVLVDLETGKYFVFPVTYYGYTSIDELNHTLINYDYSSDEIVLSSVALNGSKRLFEEYTDIYNSSSMVLFYIIAIAIIPVIDKRRRNI